MEEINEREREILMQVHTYIQMHGYSPTIRELMRLTGSTSTSVVNYWLARLKAKGYVTSKPHTTRTLRVARLPADVAR